MGNIDIRSFYLFHIAHIDKLPPILSSGELICDREIQRRNTGGTTIGMSRIKERRMNEITLNSHPDIYVGDCVPFYFCPRSIMLYMFYMNNHPDISYSGGQEPIVHLVFNMAEVVMWANKNRRKWAFTDSNAGSFHFNDYSDLADIDKLNWEAINTNSWSNCKDEKQAEFLIEESLPWQLVREIGVFSPKYYRKACDIVAEEKHRPHIEVRRAWYY